MDSTRVRGDSNIIIMAITDVSFYISHVVLCQQEVGVVHFIWILDFQFPISFMILFFRFSPFFDEKMMSNFATIEFQSQSFPMSITLHFSFEHELYIMRELHKGSGSTQL